MSNKSILKVVVAFGLLAAVLLVLAVRYVPESSALTASRSESRTRESLAGSDRTESLPLVSGRAAYFGESGRMERDFLMAARSVDYAALDSIEADPLASDRAAYFGESGRMERDFLLAASIMNYSGR